ncbi:MAG: 4-hydroxy-tetrahydrodipicolinate reductase [Chloroflexota bacterium]|nr:4-hydroxy-tetrahydrodipicolinate reductase [Chloroflexota bacterium]
MIKVIIHGAQGRMGREVLRAVCSDAELEAVGAVDIEAIGDRLALPGGAGDIPLSADLEAIISTTKPDVMVDFTLHKAAMPAIRTAARHGVNLVIGTTGFSQQDIDEIDGLSHENGIGAVVASNFALGAILMIHMAKTAAKYFDYAEIIEKHHEKKADAPSGTALSTARAMIEARGKGFTMPSLDKETLAGTRGGQVDGISVHSVRMPGYLAHQDVILGAAGQTLKISHDTISREAFMPGVVMATKRVVDGKGFFHGLENLLGL